MTAALDAVRWDLYPRIAHHIYAHEFITYLVLHERRPKTIDAYARTIDEFLASSVHTPPELVVEASEADLLNYVAQLRERMPKRPGRAALPMRPTSEGTGASSPSPRLSDATIAQRIVALRLFYDFLIHRHIRQDAHNPLPRGSLGRAGQRPKRGVVRTARHMPWIPSDDEWKRIVLHVVTQASPRNRALLILAYDTALRREEVMSLRMADFDWSKALVSVRPETSKSGRARMVPFSGFTAHVLTHYITTDRHVIVTTYQHNEHGPLFLSESTMNPGQPLVPGAFNDIVETIRKQLALPQLTPHTLRHYRLTTLKRAGVALDDIALFAGHKDLETTRLYLHIAPVELAREVRQKTKAFDTFMEHVIQEHVP